MFFPVKEEKGLTLSSSSSEDSLLISTASFPSPICVSSSSGTTTGATGRTVWLELSWSDISSDEYLEGMA